MSPAPTLSVRRYRDAHGAHAHPHFQVLWGLEGRLALEIEGRGAVLAAGQGLVLRPGERHDAEAPAGSRCLVLDTHDPAWDARVRPCHHPEAMHHLAQYLAAALDGGLTRLALLGPQLLARTWGEAPATAPARPQRAVDWDALADWARRHLAQPLATADLAARVHLSESQFRARCQAALGCSPMQWLRGLRLAQARALRASGLGVAEAARRSGYRSPSALTAAARRGR